MAYAVQVAYVDTTYQLLKEIASGFLVQLLVFFYGFKQFPTLDKF